MAPPALHLDESSNNSVVDLAPKQSIIVSLPGNPTTGYTWMRGDRPDNAADRDPAKLHYKSLSCENLKISANYKAADANNGRTGSPGTFEVQVTPKKAGTHTLKLIYARPWETVHTAEKAFTLTINAQ